jgi:hypothetical protein
MSLGKSLDSITIVAISASAKASCKVATASRAAAVSTTKLRLLFDPSDPSQKFVADPSGQEGYPPFENTKNVPCVVHGFWIPRYGYVNMILSAICRSAP